MAATAGSRFLTPWVGDQNPPPSPLASNPVIFRRYSTGIELLDRKKDRRSSMIDPAMALRNLRSSYHGKGHSRGDEDLEDDRPRNRLNRHSRDDTTSLADFLKTHEPPSSSYMSVPFAHADDKDQSKWAKFMAMKRRSKSVPRPPQNIQLPDSAVSGVTIGGHRHIAISIPLDAMPFASDSTVPPPANANNYTNPKVGGTRNEYATLPRNFAVQTYSRENGTVTVFPTAADEAPGLPQGPSTQRSSILSQQSISSSLEERSSLTQSTTGSHNKSSSQSTGYSTEASTGPGAKGKSKSRQPGYVSIFPKVSDPPHINAQGMVVWGPPKNTARPSNQQRSTRPSSMVVPASQRKHHPAHSASIDGLLSVVKDVETVRDGYSKKPLPKPPGKTDSRPKQPYKPSVGVPSPITEESTDASSGGNKRSVRKAASSQMLTVSKELPSRPSTAGSIQSRREKVRDKKRRDMEAAKALKERQRRQSVDQQKEHEEEDLDQQSQNNADGQEQSERPQAASLNTLVPIVVVVDLQPSPGLPEERSGQESSPSPSRSPSSSPDMSQMRLSRDMDSELYLQHKRNMMDKQILRLYDSYHENRLRDVERRIRRLERNGDVWLRALVPVLDDMSRNIKTSNRVNKSADADGDGRGWASDDEVSGASAERKARSAKRAKTPTRRASLSRGRIVAGLIGGKLASDDSEYSDTMSRSDDVSGLGIIEPLMRELAGEARRRQQQNAERTADDWRHNTV